MQPANEVEIYNAIKSAILDGKLRPNMQLVEEVIAESFGVSRTPVRHVLRKLAGEKLLTVIPYKGTFVSHPTVEEAKQVFEARRLLEVSSIKEACRYRKVAQIEKLRDMLREEKEAHGKQDALGVLRVTGDFHVKLAELTGNGFIGKYVEELVSLTYVIIALYGEKYQRCCHDHERILTAVEEGDAAKAASWMEEHLRELEAGLNFAETGSAAALSDIFKPRAPQMQMQMQMQMK